MTDISQDNMKTNLGELIAEIQEIIVPSYLNGSDRDNMTIEFMRRLGSFLAYYKESLDEEILRMIFGQVLMPLVDSYQTYNMGASKSIIFHVSLDLVCRQLSETSWDDVWAWAAVNYHRSYWSVLYYGKSPLVLNSLVICS